MTWRPGHWIAFWAIVSFTIVSCTLFGTNYYTNKIETMVDAGYTQTTIQGSASTWWVKGEGE